MVSVALIKKLNAEGWILYYAAWCGHCKALKKRLGPIKWALLNKVDCANTKNQCPADIPGYPTWKNMLTNALWNGEPTFR